MMNKVLLRLTFLLVLPFTITACEKCKTCNGTSVMITDAFGFTDTVTQMLSNVELCDDDLKQAEAGPITQSQSLFGVMSTTTTTYTCN